MSWGAWGNAPPEIFGNFGGYRGRTCDVTGRQFLHISAYLRICTAILRGNDRENIRQGIFYELALRYGACI